MGNLKKGKSYEAEVSEQLKKEGFEVWKPQWTRWGVKDILNRFDIIAYKKETGELLLIQVTNSEFRQAFDTRIRKVRDFEPKTISIQCLQKGGRSYEAKYNCSL